MTTLDSLVKLNADRRALRPENVLSVEKELLQLLRSAPTHFQSKTPLSAKQLLNSLSRIYHHLSVSSWTSLQRLRQVLQEYGWKYAVGFRVRTEKDEVWLDSFTEIGVDLAYAAEGYGNDSDVQALKERRISRPEPLPSDPSIEQLLSYQTYKQREAAKRNEILNTILQSTAIQNLALDRARAQHVAQHGYTPYRHYCPHKTSSQCLDSSPDPTTHQCDRVHFKPILRPHTDISLGDCSYLNTCHRMLDSCKYVHYDLDEENSGPGDRLEDALLQKWLVNIPGRETGLWTGEPCAARTELPSQWISCDVRRLDLRILGKFGILMMDPPWDIHMTLPYGTLTDDEMKDLKIQELQDDGIVLLWVTGRAMEVGRECLKRWGYNRIDELVWVKTNQLQRLIRTGRTGHWLNHSKEHVLIAQKGRPPWLNRGIDTDVIVAEVRETSRKPDEVYEIAERLCGAERGVRKLEIFGRKHNRRRGWMTIGNQLDGLRLFERDVVERWNQTHPDKATYVHELPAEDENFDNS